jgi:tetratricopeptide (TPR) repeat protein
VNSDPIANGEGLRSVQTHCVGRCSLTLQHGRRRLRRLTMRPEDRSINLFSYGITDMNGILKAGILMGTMISLAGAQAAKPPQPSPLKTGIAQFDAEKLEQAKATLTPLAKAGDAEAMLYVGRIAIEQSDGDEAIKWMEEVIKKNDRSSLYHQWLASAYSAKAAGASVLTQMSIGPSILRELNRAVELDSANIDARVTLAQLLLQAPAMMGGGVDKARAQEAAIMARDPYQGRLLEATIAENQKDTVAAERTLRDLGAAFPDSSAPATRLAIYYFNAKRYDDAFRVLEDRLRRSPNDGPALYQLGRVGAVSGIRLDRAQRALDRYLKLPFHRGSPTVAAAHWRMGMIFEAKGDRTTARAEYQTALRLDPKLAGAKASLDKLK